MISNYLKGTGLLYNKIKNNSRITNHPPMNNEPNQIQELKELIHEELKDCNHILWPKVCEMQSTPKGLAKLEEMIIRYVAQEGMGLGSAIALIEQELSHIE